MKKIKFIAAANLRLGAPFTGFGSWNPQERISRILAEAPLLAFERLINFCLEQNTDFLILSGDILGPSPLDPTVRKTFTDGLSRLSEAEIHVILTEDVKNKLYLKTLSENEEKIICLNSDGLQHFSITLQDGASVLIQGLTASFKNMETPFAILEQAGDKKSDNLKIGLFPLPIDEAALEKSHKLLMEKLNACGFNIILSPGARSREIRKKTPSVFSSGYFCSRSISETMPGACLLIQASKEENWTFTTEYPDLSTLPVRRIELNIDNMETEKEIKQLVYHSLEELLAALPPYATGALAHVRICGHARLAGQRGMINTPSEFSDILLHFMNNKPPVLAVIKDVPAFGTEFENRNDLPGVLFKVARELEADKNALALFIADCQKPLNISGRTDILNTPALNKANSDLIIDAEQRCQFLLEN